MFSVLKRMFDLYSGSILEFFYVKMLDVFVIILTQSS